MEKRIKFLDKENNLVRIEATIENGKFSMSGEVNGSLGQCQDSIKPNGKYQRKLISIWNKWHLNDLNPGTKEQMDALEKSGIDFTRYIEAGFESVYEYKCSFLEKKKLLIIDGYIYGTSWIIRDLPYDFELMLSDLMDKIQEKYNENKDRLICEDDEELFSEFSYPEEVLALSVMLELCVNEIDDIKENGNNQYRVQGIYYLCGTDGEMDSNWDDYLDNYIDDCVLHYIPEQYRNYFDRDSFKEDCKVDTRGNALNTYDGSELSVTINDTEYYAYRQ